MGPFILVDKSFLESLNAQEAEALNRHYCVFISPILIREILGNLEKSDFTPDEALRRVIALANKAAGNSSYVMHDARIMMLQDLLGAPVILQPGAPRYGAKKVIGLNGYVGSVVPPTEEEAWLQRWSNGLFTGEDRQLAKFHRDDLDNYDLLSSQKEMQLEFPENKKIESFEQIAVPFDRRSKTDELEWIKIDALCRYIPLSAEQYSTLKNKWESEGRPDFRNFAKYANYCGRVWALYYVGLTAELVQSGKRHKTIIDILYFFYLPFVQIFCSVDKFHRDHFKYFAREDQQFIWGPSLKDDLKQIVSYVNNLSKEDRLKYDNEFKNHPPFILESITRKMWEKYCRPWSPQKNK